MKWLPQFKTKDIKNIAILLSVCLGLLFAVQYYQKNFMPKRYEKIEFKSFANGVSNTDFIEENAFANTFQIKVQNNKGSIDQAWTGISTPGGDYEKDMEVHNEIGYKTWGTKVYKFNGTTFTLFQNFGGMQAVKLFKANEKLFINKAPEEMFILNEDETSFEPIGGTSDQIYPETGTDIAASDDGFIYFYNYNYVESKYEIWKTNDNFFSATMVFRLRGGYNTGCMANINGFIYFPSGRNIMRVTKTGVEVATTSESGVFYFSQFHTDYALLFSSVATGTKVEYFDGFQKILVKIIKGGDFLAESKPFFDGTWTYIEIASEEAYNLYKFDRNGNAFKVWEGTNQAAYPYPYVTRKLGGQIIFSSLNDNKWYKKTTDTFLPAGYIESGIISKGEHTPIRIIARHKPLLSNTGIKIYYSKDRSGSYGASVFTNAVAGSVRTEYDFPNTIGKISFMEIKVELTSSDNTKTPEDVEFDYIYKPLGLETSV